MAAVGDETDMEKDVDNFKHVYKRYKRRDKPLCVDDVIDFSNESKISADDVEPFQLIIPEGVQDFPGLKPLKEWKAYQLKNVQGFIVIANPFLPEYQRYWVARCLLDFSTKPNTTNVDAHMERPAQIWYNSLQDGMPDLKKESLLMKLRWATLGYQYEWNTKEYFSDRKQTFPDDLDLICRYIAAALGYSDYSSEAGIVNYYRMDSSLMGHTDVSELDKAAPLISFSFGQSCIFMIGGPTKATEPVPLFLHSGDICLMTGPARLSYHAVPRIVPANKDYLRSCFHTGHTVNNGDTSVNNDSNQCDHIDSSIHSTDTEEEDDPYSKVSKHEQIQQAFDKMSENMNGHTEPVIVTPTIKGDNCSTEELHSLMDTVIHDIVWEQFEGYVGVSRINVNVRQVLKKGLSLKPAPDKIIPCQKNIKNLET